MKAAVTTSARVPRRVSTTVFPILFAISIGHLLNDTMQSTVSALFPVLRDELHLTYGQIGLIALALNLTASFLQPVIGRFSDVRPMPRLLLAGVCFTLAGVIGLALAPTYAFILVAVITMGVGSAIFHPESSKVAYLAAGPRRGLAQSIFQVGGNTGQAMGPLMTALLFAHVGQIGVLWLAIAATVAVGIQAYVVRWYDQQLVWPVDIEDVSAKVPPTPRSSETGSSVSSGRKKPTDRSIVWAVIILIVLVASKNVYVAGMSSYYTFFMIETYGVSIGQSQWFLFAFLASSAVGTLLGGPMADRFGRRNLIWFSILGTAPFSLALPHVNLMWSGVMAIAAAFVLSSAFSIIVVYAQELLPDKIGLVSGLFFGLAFGIGGLGSALLGRVADATSIAMVMLIISFLPLLGMLTVWLPKDRREAEAPASA